MNRIAIIMSGESVNAPENNLPENKISLLFKPAREWIENSLREAGISTVYPEDFPIENNGDDILLISVRTPLFSEKLIDETYEIFKKSGKDKTIFLSEQGGKIVWAKNSPEFSAVEAFYENDGEAETLREPLVNILTAKDLLGAQKSAAAAVIEKNLENGVIFLSTDGVLISPDSCIASGATILPGTIIKGKSSVGAGSVIGPNSLLDNSSVGENSTVNASHILSSKVGNGVSIGPFAQLRPDSVVMDGAHIGDFVELKNSVIGEGTCVAHLTYVGDSDVGKNVNFGCGVVTVNYDGINKNRTQIGDYAFIGCNTNLVAPVKVGDCAYTAAGSTIIEDVPDGALAIARSRQSVKEGWADKKLKAYVEKKNRK